MGSPQQKTRQRIRREVSEEILRRRQAGEVIICPPPDERVALIVRIMARNQYTTGSTVLILAKRWGLSLDIVTRDIQEASRQVKAIVERGPEIKERIRVGVDWSAKAARELYEANKDKPLCAAAALRAYNESMRVLTAVSRPGQDMDRSGEPKRYAHMTDDELMEELRKP